MHREIELVVALGPQAKIFGHAVGLDITRRGQQAAAKKLGRPWETAKGFDHSAPIGAIVASDMGMTRGGWGRWTRSGRMGHCFAERRPPPGAFRATLPAARRGMKNPRMTGILLMAAAMAFKAG